MRRTPTEALKRVAAWANPRVLAGGRTVRGGLVMVLTTPDPPPIWRGRWRRRFAFAAVGALTLVLGSAALAGLFGGRGVVTDIQGALIVAAVAVVIRYPLLSWRLAWLALTLTVLFGDQLPPHKPWSPLQLPVLTGGVLDCRDPARPAADLVDLGIRPPAAVALVRRPYRRHGPRRRHGRLYGGRGRGRQPELAPPRATRPGRAGRADRARAGTPCRSHRAHQDRPRAT